MKNLGDILGKNKFYKRFLNDFQVADKIKKNWDDLFGRLANDLSFYYYNNRVLAVFTSNPLWKNEIKFFKQQLLVKLSEVFNGKKIVLDIKVYTKKLSDEKLVDFTVSGLSFEEKIKLLNDRRKKKGLKLCQNCNEHYTPDPVCVHCRSFELYCKGYFKKNDGK